MSVPILQLSNSGAHVQEFRTMLARPDLVRWSGLFAFATLDGVVLLDEEPTRSLSGFLMRDGAIRWIIGIDAVTTAGALQRLQKIQTDFDGSVVVSLYRSHPGQALYHPKLSIFEFEDGSGSVLVGSSNLTAGGQVRNVELSARLDVDGAELSAWLNVYDQIEARNENLTELSAAVIEETASRRRTERKAARDAGLSVTLVEAEPQPDVRDELVLIRVVPRAGGRWSQVGIPEPDVKQFFGLDDDVPERTVRLQLVQPDGSVGPVRERRLVHSEINDNHRIEIQGLEGIPYPDNGRPILLVLRVEADFFRYFVLFPGDPGHAEIAAFADSVPRTGGALPSHITDVQGMTEVWTDFPL